MLRMGADPNIPNTEGKIAEDLGDDKLKSAMSNRVKKMPSYYLRKPEMTRARYTKWILVAAFTYLSSIVVCSLYSFLAAGITLVVLSLFNSRVLLYPRVDEQNPFLASITLTTFFVQCYFTVVKILPGQLSVDLLVYCHLLVAAVVFSAFMNLQVWTSDPGNLEVSTTQDFKELQQDMRDGAPITLCTICKVRRPLRAKHVRQTDRCVARFDHYCDWIGAPVGANNHKSFMLFLLLVPVHCALYLYLGYGVLPSSSEPTILLRLYAILQDDRAFSVSLFQATFFFLAMIMQSLQQLHFIGMNLTINEALNKKRYPHFWHNGQWFNPFSLGNYYSNFRQFLFGNIDWKRIFYLDRDLPQTYRQQPQQHHGHGGQCCHGSPPQKKQEGACCKEGTPVVEEEIVVEDI